MPTHLNPLLNDNNTPFGTFPFTECTPNDIETALTEGMLRELQEVEQITGNTEDPSFQNTIEALENTGSLLHKAETILGNLTSACTNDTLDNLEARFAPMIAEHSARIMHNPKLFQRIKHVYDTASTESYTAEQRMLLKQTYLAFERSGATLTDKDKKIFEAKEKELASLCVQFSQNKLKELQDYQLHLTEESQLRGLPDTTRQQAILAAQVAGLSGWVITLDAPSYQSFMTYADNRDLRKQLYMAYNTICTHANGRDNFSHVQHIVNRRLEIAQIIGYESFAHYTLKQRMAETPEMVEHFLQSLIEHYRPAALDEVKAVQHYAQTEEGDEFKLEPWDFSYYSRKLRQQLYDIDAEMLRPYLELSRVRQGVFGLATQLYNITFHRRYDIPVYYPDVETYEVIDDDGQFLAVLYCDFHPRSGKRSGAWMTNYKEQWQTSNGKDSRPHVAIVMNLTKPTPRHPSLLTLEEVGTFLHEFGHALHGILARTHYRSLSGTNVFWDFVELPSQFMENYLTEKEFLRTFAVHYITGEPIPDTYIERIIASRTFNVAYACIRQVAYALLDMAYYTRKEPLTEDILSFESEAWKQAQLLPQVPKTCTSVQFSHIMTGGYSAGYYSYKWAEVLDADAFSLFQEKGIFNTEVAQSFRQNILERGGTEPPTTLYRRFRGREPQIIALLKRDGITSLNQTNNTLSVNHALS